TMKLSDPAAAKQPDPADELYAHFLVIPAVATAVASRLAEPTTPLTALTMTTRSQFDLRWPNEPPANDITGPRRLASAALLQWAKLADAETADEQALDTLRTEALQKMALPRNPGRRAATTQIDVKKTTEELARSLLATSPETLRAQVIA